MDMVPHPTSMNSVKLFRPCKATRKSINSITLLALVSPTLTGLANKCGILILFPPTLNTSAPSLLRSMCSQTGWIDISSHSTSYPSDNCAALYTGAGTLKVPQDEYYKYLSHDAPNSGKSLINKFMNSSAYVQSQGKPFIMFETNTASCGGFPGISNSFGSGLWALDYGLQMAYSNFSHALLHIGGQDVYYNVSSHLFALASDSRSGLAALYPYVHS